MKRRDKINYYLDIAEAIAARSTCLRRHYGAIVVQNDQIISTGYSGAPRGRANCCDLGRCIRKEMNIPRGERYELCRGVHAEANAIIHASRQDMLGATLFLAGVDAVTGEYVLEANSCAMCKKMIINSGITTVIIRDNKEDFRSIKVYDEWVSRDETLSGAIGY
mgnify:CR=1 FL=1